MGFWYTKNMGSAESKAELCKLSSRKKAQINSWFFKTGKGEYGEGDEFIGVSVPDVRAVAKWYIDLSFDEITKLLASPVHEERLLALIILTLQFDQPTHKAPAWQVRRRKIYQFYLKNTKHINNWDLVDVSAYKIVGAYLLDKPRAILDKLAKSKSVWERRIAIVSTFAFIRVGQCEDTLRIATLLHNDSHDLIHKAVGWMLREVGKRDVEVLEKYLKNTYKTMPRTMLRYAIEKLASSRRRAYLRGTI